MNHYGQIQAIWEEIPNSIKGLAVQHSCNSSIFRDELFKYLKKHPNLI